MIWMMYAFMTMFIIGSVGAYILWLIDSRGGVEPLTPAQCRSRWETDSQAEADFERYWERDS